MTSCINKMSNSCLLMKSLSSPTRVSALFPMMLILEIVSMFIPCASGEEGF